MNETSITSLFPIIRHQKEKARRLSTATKGTNPPVLMANYATTISWIYFSPKQKDQKMRQEKGNKIEVKKNAYDLYNEIIDSQI